MNESPALVNVTTIAANFGIAGSATYGTGAETPAARAPDRFTTTIKEKMY